MKKSQRTERLLVVGAGGIGCELLKSLVLSGYLDIHVVDLDTVDLSNLNRQFLFRQSHIGKPKAVVAAEAVTAFNPKAKVVPYFKSIFDADPFSIDWFAGFNIILNALDNIPARRHVNMMAVAANIPLIESGTAGYLGQVTVHRAGIPCFDCEPKPAPKTFPVCTIRSTPSLPLHCIVWAKTWLMGALFSSTEEDSAELDQADANEKELENLKTENREMSDLRAHFLAADYPRRVFEKIFGSDVVRLASMEDLWKDRKPPVPQSYPSADILAKTIDPDPLDREQKIWSFDYTCKVFSESLVKLTQAYALESKSDPEYALVFSKDDPDCVDFTTAAANLRAWTFPAAAIPASSRWKVQEVAGNIIPAIATTNAIIAGLIVLNAGKVLDGNSPCRNAYLSRPAAGRTQLLNIENPAKPNPACGVCASYYVRAVCDTSVVTLDGLLDAVVRERLSLADDVAEVSGVEEGGRLIYDPDFTDNSRKSLELLGIVAGKRVTLNIEPQDQDLEDASVIVFIRNEKTGSSGVAFVGDAAPKISFGKKKQDPSLKRKAPDDDDEADGGRAEGIKGMGKIRKVEDVVEILDENIIIL